MKKQITIIGLLIFSTVYSQEKKIDTVSALKEIQQVEIVGKKKIVERKADRLIFNVENSVAAQGGDAIDALKVTPGVKITGDDIKIVGKNSVKVMVNDKIVQLGGEELQSYLKSIQTANIQKIEVITNPPAKYDAEGNSGLINIQLKEVRQDNWNATLRSGYQQATYEQLTHGAGFSYKKNKFSALADVNYRYGRNLYTNDIYYEYPSELWNLKMFNRNHRKNLTALLNLNYDLTSKSALGFQFLGGFWNNTSDEFNDNFSRSYADATLLKYYKTNGEASGKPNNLSMNVNFNHKLDDKGKKFSIDADYFRMKSAKNNEFNSDLQNLISGVTDRSFTTNFSEQQIDNYSLKTDWELPYEWANLSFGAKVNSTKTKNLVDTKFYNRDNNAITQSRNDHFEYTENTEALYISANRSLGKKWEAKAGLRGEFTQTKANSVSMNEVIKRDYFKLFPTVYIAFKPNENHTFSANYGKRIGRPGFWQMNPARDYDSPKSYTTGNPFLQPRFTDEVELNYAYKSFLSAGVFFQKTKGDISQVIRHNPQDESQTFRHENYANSIYSGGNISVTFTPLKFWETTMMASAVYGETNPYDQTLYSRKYSGWMGDTSSNNTFTLNKSKTLQASLNYWYSFPSKGVGNGSASSSLDIGFKYLAFDKKLTVGLNFEDIFKNSQATYYQKSGEINQSFAQYYDSQLVRLSLMYKFGNNKININKRQSGNEEEKKRAN